MAASTYFAQIQQLYIAYFGRPADPVGQAYWAGQVDAANGSIASVIAGFSASTESAALFGNKSSIDKVTAIYQNAFGRAPEPAGLAYWVAQLDSGKVSQAQASWTIQQSAGPGDAAAVQNKLTAAQAFTAQIDTTAEIQGYQGDAAAASARSFLAAVTQDNATATAAVNGAAAAVAAATALGVPGTTFTLTTGADNFAGTANADTFNGSIDSGVAAQNTLGAADKIVGGAGIDTLNVTVNTGTTATNGADISGVEVLNVRNIQAAAAPAVAVDASTVPGLTTVVSDRSTGALTVSGLATGATLGLKGNGTTVTGAVSGTYVDAATAATLTLDSGVVAATPVVSITGAGLTSATITSKGAANSLATNGINFTNGAVKAVTVDAQTNVSTGTITGLAAASTITVKGAGTANIGTLTNVTTLDASANIGGVTANLGTATTLVATGGAGNDVFTTGAVLATGANVNAGAGTADRLVVSNSAHLTAAAGALYKGFEQVQVADGVTADVSLLAANNTINTVIIADGAGATGVSGLTAAQAANVQIASANAAGAITIGVIGASTAGQIDTVKAALTTSTAAGVAQNIDLTGLSLAGVEKLELTANGTTAANSGTVTLNTAAASSLDSIILKSAGVNSITVTTAGSNLSVDASGSTGNTTINAGGYVSTTGASLKGGAGHDVLVGSAQSDSIVAGAGNDVLATSGIATVTAGSATATAAAAITNIAATVATAADVLTGGAGNDSFVIAHSAVADISSITDLNLGTNAAAGTVDSLWFNGTAAAATVVTLTAAQQTTVTAAASLSAAVDAVLAIAATGNNVAQFTYGADTYIVANGATANAAYTATEDTLIKITGVTGVLDASDIHFVAA